MTNKLKRDVIRLIEDEGCQVLNAGKNGKSHLAYTVIFSGQEKVFVGPATPSDRRAMLNFRTDLRKWMRGQQCGTG